MTSTISFSCLFCFGIVVASGVHIRGEGYPGSIFSGVTSSEVQPQDSGVCFRNTGGTCRRDPCLETRGPTECIDSYCFCAPGFCANTSGVCIPHEGQLIGSHAIRSLTRGLGNSFGAQPKYLGVEHGFKPCNQGGDACFPSGPDYYTTVVDTPQQWLFYDIGDGYVRIESVDAPGYWLSTVPVLSLAVKSRKQHHPVNALHSSWKITGDQDKGFKIVEAKGFLLVYMNSFRLLPRIKTYAVAQAAYISFIILVILIALFSFWCISKSAFRCWIVFVLTCMAIFCVWVLLWFDPDCGVGICLGDISCMGRQEFIFEPPIDEGIIDGDGVWTKPTVVGIFGDAWRVVPLALCILVLFCCVYLLAAYSFISSTSVPTTDQTDAKMNTMEQVEHKESWERYLEREDSRKQERV